LNWKVFGISAGLTIVVPSIILGVLATLGQDPHPASELFVFTIVISAITGIIIGECIFFVLDTLAKRRYKWIRGVSSILSGPVALLAGSLVGWQIVGPIFHSMVFEPHPGFALGHEDSLFYQGVIIECALIAGLAGLIFGAGIGQRTRRQ